MEVSVGLVGIVQRPAVLIGRSACTIFRHTHRRACSLFLRIVEELVSLPHSIAVPAEILVPGQQVGNAEIEFRIDAGGEGCQSRGVETLVDAIDFLEELGGVVVANEVVLIDEHLVEDGPEADRRVIELLIDEFVGTLARILLEAWRIEEARVGHATGTAEGNLGPKHDAVLVAEAIHLLVVWIMCQAQKGRSRLEYQCHIFLIMFGQKG